MVTYAQHMDEEEQAHSAHIERLHVQLATGLQDAQRAVRQATTALTALMGDDVYDVEVAEGSEGRDLAAELEDVARRLRMAERTRRSVAS